jgi:hypothetical protein
VYRRTNREVRIHECHSACTMALGLPNVCVYPDSVFKFHQAYDPRNHNTNWYVSDQLFNTYPVAVRERLGTLTRNFTVLRGSELIELGVRNCAEPQPRILLAQAKVRSLPEGGASGRSTLAMLTGKLQGMIPNLGVQPELVPGSEVPDVAAPDAVPLPPPRPKVLVAYAPGLPPMPMVRIIDGAQPILPAHFVPFPKGA